MSKILFRLSKTYRVELLLIMIMGMIAILTIALS